MEADEDDDMLHMCLVCHATIKGTVNYFAHRKNKCVGNRGQKEESDIRKRNSLEKRDDFFQSLELLNQKDQIKAKKETGQPLLNLQISNTLSDPSFSSDEEECMDDVSFESLPEDSGSNTCIDGSSSIENRHRFREKSPPGHGPAVNTSKHQQRPSKGGKNIIKESHIKCKCMYCGLVMTSQTRLKRHVVLKHKDKEVVSGVVKTKKCERKGPKCSKQFTSKDSPDLNKRKRYSYKCHYCQKEFTNTIEFKRHKNTSKHLNKVLTGKAQKRETHTCDNTKEVHQNHGSMFKITEVISEIKMEHDGLNFDLETPNDDSNLTADFTSVQEKDSIKEETNHEISTSLELCDKYKGDYNPGAKLKEVFKSTPIKMELENEIKAENCGKRTHTKTPEEMIAIKKTYTCDHCSFTVSAYDHLRPHYLMEHAAHTITCEICDIVFLSKKTFYIHCSKSKEHQEKGVQTEENKYFECYICKKKFTDEKYCKFHTSHIHFHITSEEGVIRKYGEKSITREKFKAVLADMEQQPNSARIECPECKVYIKKPNFLEHLRIHTGEKPFKCNMCPKAFMAGVTLRKHLLGHFGCQERTCETCNKHFKDTSGYERHRQVHEAEKSSAKKMHVCDTCGLSFYLVKQLQSHMRRHKDKEFKCTVQGCNWKFLFATELKYHMRTHSNQKPFLCDICGFAAATEKRLAYHHRTHTGERNYPCEYCPYKAGNSTHLHRHMRIHIGSKPFKCPYCEYSCNTYQNMRKHVIQTKKHEGLKMYPCKFCEYSTNSGADFRNHLMEMHETDLGPNVDLITGLSKFSGLFNKNLDPKQPSDGNEIHQVKERKPRKRKGANELDGVSKVLIDASDLTKDVAAILGENGTDSESGKSETKVNTSDFRNHYTDPGQIPINGCYEDFLKKRN